MRFSMSFQRVAFVCTLLAVLVFSACGEADERTPGAAAGPRSAETSSAADGGETGSLGDLPAPPPTCVADCTGKECGDDGCGGSCGGCDDGNSCTTDVCETDFTCSNPPVSNGTACDDGQFCNVGETCQSGNCTGGSELDCGTECATGTCNETTDQCELGDGAEQEGDYCSDGLWCTELDRCHAGECVGSPRDCTWLDGTCTVGVCSEAVEDCVADVLQLDGTNCDDGLFCTVGETCTNGVCSAGNLRDCSIFDDQCNTGVCNDDSNSCVTTPRMDGTGCDDGQWCTISDSCLAGTCTGQTRCDDGIDCTANGCNESIQQCVFTPVDSACSDGNPCNGAEICVAGTGCQAGQQVDCSVMDGPCVTGVCLNMGGGEYSCTGQPKQNGSWCDGGLCATDASCSNGTCVGTGVDCDDGIACTADSCDSQLGCVHTPVDSACNDYNSCTVDSCEEGVGCVFDDNNGVACDDYNLCTSNDTCSEGACQGTPKDCSHLDAVCVVGVCTVSNGQCVAQSAANGDSCDDSNPCTANDTCSDGTCVGVGDSCDDGIICTIDSCDVEEGCTHTPNHGLCDDSNVCTTDTCVPGVGCVNSDNAAACNSDPCMENQQCSGGSCQGGVMKSCAAYDGPCVSAYCDAFAGSPENDYCVVEPLLDGVSCDDENWCTQDTTCLAGVCVGSQRDCDDGIPCTVDSCDSGFEICRHTPDNTACSDEDVCTVDSCIAGYGCSQTFVQNLECDDANPCTTGDVCVSSTIGCRGTLLDCSHLSANCVAGVCNPASGQCEAQPAGVGDMCDDMNFCTEGETCNAEGECVGAPRDCDDGLACTFDGCDSEIEQCTHTAIDSRCNDDNICTDDSCDTTAGCVFEPNAAACDDADPCTETDVCSDGVCGGMAKDCSHLDAGCMVGVCDPESGACTTMAAPDDTGCDDDNWCTVGDVCTNGVCGGVERDCADDFDCTTDACDAEFGQCTHSPDSTLCDDGEVCTEDYCSPLLGCFHNPAMGGCDDNDACTEGDSCQEGACVGFPIDCSGYDDDCHAGVCVEGACQTQAANDGQACDTGEFCTIDAVCANGACVGQANPCDDGVACTVDSCDNGTGCAHIPDDGACADSNSCTVETCDAVQGCLSEVIQGGCDDNDACTVGDMCQEGRCIPGERTDCSQHVDACHTASCNPETGYCDVIYLGDGADCDDGKFCTVSTTCQQGQCLGSFQGCNDGIACTTDLCNEELDRCDHEVNHGDCMDQNPCTDDVCDPTLGCTNTPNTNACSDSDACTVGDICTDGACVPGTATDCSGLADACHTAVCNTGTGACDVTYLGEGAGCDDGDPCTVNPTCQQGACVGAPRDCDDAIACTADACDPQSGACTHDPRHAQCGDENICTDDICDLTVGCTNPDNSANCDDGNPCTVGDACAEGNCQPGTPRDCAQELGPCRVGECNLESGACEGVDLENGVVCDDGDWCTLAGTCQQGACETVARDCSDEVVCTIDTCNAEAQRCDHTPDHSACFDDNLCTDDVCDGTTGCSNAPNSDACDDDNLCTLGDVCAEGQCVPGNLRDCSDLDDGCLLGICNPADGECATQPLEDNSACETDNWCSVNDVCLSGVCVDGNARDCDDEIDCTVDSCNSQQEACANEIDDSLCDDDDPCTGDFCRPSRGGCESDPLPDGWPCGEDSQCWDSVCREISDGEVCARPLVVETGVVFSGSTAGLLDTYHGGDCTPLSYEGPELWLQWTPEPGDYIATLSPVNGVDLALVMVSDCNPILCVAVVDQAGLGGEEALGPITIDAQNSGEPLVFAVDSLDADRAGAFDLLIARVPDTDGDTDADDDSLDGDVSDGDIVDGDVSDGDIVDGDVSDGDIVDGDVSDGDIVDGDVSDGDSVDGDVSDGDSVDGDVTDGDVTDGDVADGDEDDSKPDGDLGPDGDLPEDGDEPDGDLIPDGDEPEDGDDTTDGDVGGGGGGCQQQAQSAGVIFLILLLVAGVRLGRLRKRRKAEIGA